MIRLHFVVEGQTEEGFVNQVLANHLGHFGVSADARCVETSRRKATIYRGGVIDYRRVRLDLGLWMREDQREDAYFTTMIDLYGLPTDFPGYLAASATAGARVRVAALEQAFADDIAHPRFVPHIQLHEFEALILAGPRALDWEFPEHEPAIDRLVLLASGYKSPECIDDGPDTAPSKRIMQQIPAYIGRKASAGPLVVGRIGLAAVRYSCPHFDAWVSRLQALGEQGARL